MAIELDKQGNIKWSFGDRVFNIAMVVLFGWCDLLGNRPGGSDEE